MPGLSHDSKRALLGANIRTVGDLAAVSNLGSVNRTVSWSLQNKSETLISRARAIALGAVVRNPNAYSLHMPPRVDVALLLLSDFDPVGGGLVSLGYLRMHGEDRKELIEVLPSGKREEEAAAIKRVLGAALADLSVVDQWNAAESNPRYTRTSSYTNPRKRSICGKP